MFSPFILFPFSSPFPTAATTTIPLSFASWNILFISTVDVPVQPKLRFITSTFWSIAYLIASYTYARDVVPSSSSAFIGNILTLLGVQSKMIPPVWVPCPYKAPSTVSALSVISVEFCATFLYLLSILSLKLFWLRLEFVKSNPVSITATTMSSFVVLLFILDCVSFKPIV